MGVHNKTSRAHFECGTSLMGIFPVVGRLPLSLCRCPQKKSPFDDLLQRCLGHELKDKIYITKMKQNGTGFRNTASTLHYITQ